MEEAEKARAVAELEAKLTLAAESQLSWERRDDFEDRDCCGLETEPDPPKDVECFHSATSAPSHTHRLVAQQVTNQA